MVESLLKEYPNVLTLRVRMPIVADLVYPRNFITKIIKYDKVRGQAAGSCGSDVVCGCASLCNCNFWCMCCMCDVPPQVCPGCLAAAAGVRGCTCAWCCQRQQHRRCSCKLYLGCLQSCTLKPLLCCCRWWTSPTA